jgi:predicted metal-binding membrane protein
VMNVYVIVALTTFVLLEKVLPGGETVSRIAGAALILLAILQLVS